MTPSEPTLGTCEHVDTAEARKPHEEKPWCRDWTPLTDRYEGRDAPEPREVEPLSEERFGTCRAHVNPKTPHPFDRGTCWDWQPMDWPTERHDQLEHAIASRDAAESESLRLRERNERLERVVGFAKAFVEFANLGTHNDLLAALAALEENQ